MSVEPKSGEKNELRSEVTEEEEISKEKRAGNSVSNEGNVDSAIVEQNQGGSNEDQQVRRCTRTGVLINLENARKKARKAGMAVKTSIRNLDNLLREQCTDIVKLSASNGGLTMDIDDFKRFHEEVMDLSLLSSNDDHYGVEDQRFFDEIRESFLERASSTSSKQAVAKAAALKEKMLSLKRKQDLERQQEELKQHQRELESKMEQEYLQGEINAAEAIHQTLLGGTDPPCNDTQPTSPVVHEHR